jgi:hypothetical protein
VGCSFQDTVGAAKTQLRRRDGFRVSEPINYTSVLDSIEQSRDGLWARWQKAFDRLSEVTEAAKLGQRVVYARVPLFDLDRYRPPKFPAGGRILKELPPASEMAGTYYVYRLDHQDRPVHMAARHTYNKVDWQGMYRYSAEEVEYVEFCLQTEIVSQYDRLTLQGRQPTSLQRIRMNCAGHFPRWHGSDAIAHIRSDPHNYFVRIEHYDLTKGQIVSGSAFSEGFGGSPQHSTLDYFYAAEGKLERIIQTWASGHKQTIFAARSKVSLKELSTKLSERIATATLQALQEAKSGSPLVAVELSYRSVDQYVPFIIPATEAEDISSLTLVSQTPPGRWITLDHEQFEPEMTEFVQRIFDAERYELASKMLRHAALLVTRLAAGSLSTSPGFVAFAMDWEMEGDQLASILKQCGADPAAMKLWRKKGWLT